MKIDWRQGIHIGAAIVLCLAVAAGGARAAQAQSPDPASAPMVLAFYYTWFDQSTWTPSKVSDLPAQPYVSADRAAMARHVDQAKAAGIDAFVVSWYGPTGDSNQTEPNFRALLEIGQERGFKLAVDFETASPFMKGQGEIVAGLKHLLSVHAPQPAYLKWADRPVIFFWAIQRVPTAVGQSALDAWRSIRQQVDPDRRSVWIAEGVDVRYQEVFDGHHLYSVAWSKNVAGTLADWGSRVRKWSQANGARRLWVATVMPGYNDLRTGRTDAFVTDRRGGAFYQAAWQGAMASQADWVIITSFNEWVEGSQIEPSQSYGNQYLDLTRDWAGRYKAGALLAPTVVATEATLTTTAAITPTSTATRAASTATRTATVTAMATVPGTATMTTTPTMIATPTVAATTTSTGTATESATPTVTETETGTSTPIATPTPTADMTAALAKTMLESAVATPSETGSSASSTATPATAGISAVDAWSTRVAEAVAGTATAASTEMPVATATGTATATARATDTPRPTATATASATEIATVTVAATATPVPSPSATATVTATATPIKAMAAAALVAEPLATAPRPRMAYIPPAVAAGLATVEAQKAALLGSTPLPTSARDSVQLASPGTQVALSAVQPLTRTVPLPAGQADGTSKTLGTALIVAGVALFLVALILAALFLLGSNRRV